MKSKRAGPAVPVVLFFRFYVNVRSDMNMTFVLNRYT